MGPEEGVTNRKKPFHTPAAASISADLKNQYPSSSASEHRSNQKRLSGFTLTYVRKYAELTANPYLALHFYDETKKVQIRLETTACLYNRDEVAAEAWSLSQPMSKVCYATAIHIRRQRLDATAALSLEEANMEIGYGNFAVVEGAINYLEWLLQLSAKGIKLVFDGR